MKVEEKVLRSIIDAVVTKHQVFEKKTSYSSKIWLEIFQNTFGKSPDGNTDSLWDRLLDQPGLSLKTQDSLGAMKILSELEKEYHIECERKKIEKRVVEYKRKQEEMMENY